MARNAGSAKRHFGLGERLQKGRQVIRVVLDMVGLKRIRGHKHGAHAHGVGRGKIAGVIFEHGGGGGIGAILGKDRLERHAFGFRAKGGVLHSVDGIKAVGQATGGKHIAGIGGRAVCVHDAATGQGGDGGGQGRVGRQGGKGNVVHIDKVRAGGNVVFGHQACKRSAMGLPVMGAQAVSLGAVNAKYLHDPIGHLDLDLVKQAGGGRIKGIVEVKDPVADVREQLAHGCGCSGPGGLLARGRAGSLCKMFLKGLKAVQKDAYSLILEAIDAGFFKPGDRLVESELADRFGVSRTPVREALQRLETQGMLSRDGRSLIVSSLDHNQLAELYAVRTELEGLAARLAARAATEEEVRVLRGMVEADRRLIGGDPKDLSRANKRFHKQIHLASHNRFLIQQLDLVHRSMALMATTSFAAEGRDEIGLAEHDRIIAAIEARDPEAAYQALRTHISKAFETRLRVDAGELRTR